MAAPLLDTITDPVRRDVVRHLAAHETASLAELADCAGVHPNTVRRHVLDLERAGMVVGEPAPPCGRGRPPLRYRLADGVALPTSDFRGLAELLAAALARAGLDEDELRELGRDWGRFLLGRPGQHALERDLPGALERLGFDARLEGTTLFMSACPCRLVLPDRPELICRLAMAVVEGFVEGSRSGLTVARSEHDPGRRLCRATLRAEVVA